MSSPSSEPSASPLWCAGKTSAAGSRKVYADSPAPKVPENPFKCSSTAELSHRRDQLGLLGILAPVTGHDKCVVAVLYALFLWSSASKRSKVTATFRVLISPVLSRDNCVSTNTWK
jgi:hypothetical protein